MLLKNTLSPFDQITIQKNNDSILVDHQLLRQQIQVLRRVPQPLILYILVNMADIAKVIIQILFVTNVAYVSYYYTIVFGVSVVQIIIWLINSTILTRGFNLALVKFYTSMDLLLIFTIISGYTYVQLNIQFNQLNHIQNIFIVPALTLHSISLFFFIGNFRASIYNADWSRIKVIFYKIIRILTVVAFMRYTIVKTLQQRNEINELLLLWISMTVGLQTQTVVRLSKLDGSDRPYKQMYNLDDENYE